MNCPHLRADSCAKLPGPDRAVTPAICAACPFTVIGCAWLRFSLTKTGEAVTFSDAACAERVIPIHSPADCHGCQQRVAIRLEDVQPVLQRQAGKLLVFPYKRVRL